MSIYKLNSLDYYVYAYLREDGTPYYIGKGKGNRAFRKDRLTKPPRDRSRIVFCETNLTESEAFALERRLIRYYGRKDNGTGILRNLTDGGEGSSGVLVREDTRKKLSEKFKGEKNPMYGKPVPEERKKYLSEINTGEKNPMYGKTHTDEIRKHLSEKVKGEKNPMYGKPVPEERKKYLSEINTGDGNPMSRRKRMEYEQKFLTGELIWS